MLSLTTFAYLINTASAVKMQPKYIVNFSGIGYKNQVFAATFGLTILAIAGIPPLAGFFSKFLVILSVIGAEYYATALVVIFFSSIACFYYIRIIKVMFFVNTTKNNL
jgi:NADH-quinone oxidoreductase subunit N